MDVCRDFAANARVRRRGRRGRGNREIEDTMTMMRKTMLRRLHCARGLRHDRGHDPRTGHKAQIGKWGVDLAGMDTSVKPGDDFYRYVNGTLVRPGRRSRPTAPPPARSPISTILSRDPHARHPARSRSAPGLADRPTNRRCATCFTATSTPAASKSSGSSPRSTISTRCSGAAHARRRGAPPWARCRWARTACSAPTSAPTTSTRTSMW